MCWNDDARLGKNKAKCNGIICNNSTCLSSVAIEQKQYTWEDDDFLKLGEALQQELKYLKWESKKENAIFPWNFSPASRVGLLSY